MALQKIPKTWSQIKKIEKLPIEIKKDLSATEFDLRRKKDIRHVRIQVLENSFICYWFFKDPQNPGFYLDSSKEFKNVDNKILKLLEKNNVTIKH